MSDDELIGHAFTLFAAGHETTSNALTWTIFLLGQHPRIFADLLDELEGTLHGDAPTIEQLGELHLLDGVIKESLRLLPPAPIGLRRTSAVCDLGGFTLQKGTDIIYSEYVSTLMTATTDKTRMRITRIFILIPAFYDRLLFPSIVKKRSLLTKIQ